MSTPNIKFSQLSNITEKIYHNLQDFEQKNPYFQQNDHFSLSRIEEQLLVNELCGLLDEEQVKTNLDSHMIERIQRLFGIMGKNQLMEEQEQLFSYKQESFKKLGILIQSNATPKGKQKKIDAFRNGNIKRFGDKSVEKNGKNQKKRQTSENSIKSKQRQNNNRQKVKLKFFVDVKRKEDNSGPKRNPLRQLQLNNNSGTKSKQQIQKSSSKKLMIKKSISQKNLSNKASHKKIKAQVISPTFSNKKENLQTKAKSQSKQKRTINNSSSLKKIQSTQKLRQRSNIFQLKHQFNQKIFDAKFPNNLYSKSNSNLSTAQLTKFNTLSDDFVVKKANQLIRRVNTQEQNYKQAMVENFDDEILFYEHENRQEQLKEDLREDKEPLQQTSSLQLMKTISSIQSNTLNEQTQLENRINNFKLLISGERAKIEDCKSSSSSIKKQIIDLQEQIGSIKRKKDQIHKKLQQVWSEVKSLNSGISDCKNQNQSVLVNVRQEKELIKMYGKVIEQMKGQLKVQIETRDQLKNLIKHSKKQKQALKLRALNTKDKADFIKNRVKESINKWII